MQREPTPNQHVAEPGSTPGPRRPAVASVDDGACHDSQPAQRPVLVPLTTAPTAPAGRAERARAAVPRRPQVHIAPNLREFVTEPAVPVARAQAAREQRDVNHIVHLVLIVGLVLSAGLMLVGVGLDVLRQRELPATIPTVRETIQRAVALRPSGFLALGLLTLILTPILRVVGSIAAFIYERDWRYAAITGLVLGVILLSLMVGAS